MASQTQSYYDKKKMLGKTYTPTFVANEVLDDAGYCGRRILGKKILDPAYGDGSFLTEVVKRIVAVSPVKDLCKNLQYDVYGWEIDPEAVKKRLANLNRIVEPQGIKTIRNKGLQFDAKPAKKSLYAHDKISLDYIDGKKPGEIVEIHVGITTLADRICIFKVSKNNGKTTEVIAKSGEIMEMESEILKPIIKASTLKSTEQPIGEAILFPYKKRDGKHVVIEEIELRENYPLAYAYLKSVKKDLDKRDAGKPNPVAWYAFGRSQGLDTSFGPKILFSPMNLRPNFVWRPEAEATFYSGYCIKFDGDPEPLLNQLNSERMQKHIEGSGRNYRGGWKAYNRSNVSQFTVTL